MIIGLIMEPRRSRIYKITLLGDGSVGKTSLRKAYLGEDFKGDFNQTIGADFALKKLHLNGQNVVLQLWDFTSQQRNTEVRFNSFHSYLGVRKSYYRGTSGCLFVFDITQQSSFENIPSWIVALLKNNNERVTPMVLIGNKSDLRPYANDVIERKQAEDYAHSLSQWAGFSVAYIETSAITGENTLKAFETLLKNLDSQSGGGGGLAPYPRDPGDDMTGAAAGMPRRYKDDKRD